MVKFASSLLLKTMHGSVSSVLEEANQKLILLQNYNPVCRTSFATQGLFPETKKMHTEDTEFKNKTFWGKNVF